MTVLLNAVNYHIFILIEGLRSILFGRAALETHGSRNCNKRTHKQLYEQCLYLDGKSEIGTERWITAVRCNNRHFVRALSLIVQRSGCYQSIAYQLKRVGVWRLIFDRKCYIGQPAPLLKKLFKKDETMDI